MPNPATPDLAEVLTVDDVAELLQVHPQTVRELYRDQGLPSHRLGGRGGSVRFIRAEVLDWLRSRCSATTGTELVDGAA